MRKMRFLILPKIIWKILRWRQPPKKIQNLNLKEKFRHINQMIEEDKKHSSKNGLLKKANPEFSTMIKPEISITFDT